MISRSNSLISGDGGVSLFEMLIVLAILAGLAGLAVSGLQGPSPLLIARGQAAEVQRDASEARLRAVRTGAAVRMEVLESTCLNEGRPAMVFHPDGTMDRVRLCFGEGLGLVLLGDELTGSLRPEEAE